jgi:hypothetical protein
MERFWDVDFIESAAGIYGCSKGQSDDAAGGQMEVLARLRFFSALQF